MTTIPHRYRWRRLGKTWKLYSGSRCIAKRLVGCTVIEILSEEAAELLFGKQAPQ